MIGTRSRRAASLTWCMLPRLAWAGAVSTAGTGGSGATIGSATGAAGAA